jgi:ubiquinone/menaquinone biosynthesis C-methylase UbiE
MFGKYWYRSGINETMKLALKDIVDSILRLRKNDSYINKKNTWLDIASNDGTLLSFVPSNYYRIGIDPCEDSFQEEARKHSELNIQDYFSHAEIERYTPRKADIITSIAMFYDVLDRDTFLNDINSILKDDGLWVMQLSYTPLMLKQLAFDNICHEHYYYYSLSNLKKLLERYGFKVIDVQLNNVNGGSFRVYVQKKDATSLMSQPDQDVCSIRINSLLTYEKEIGIDAPFTWLKFMSDIAKLSNEVKDFIKSEVEKGKTVWGYGASTKGNTLLQYFELDNTLITAIADRTEYKHGLKTVGTNIPIVSEEAMRIVKPDYLLILPWHFIDNFIEREKDYLNNGGHFIVPCPKLKII